MKSLFTQAAENYTFASGDFWYAWPTKLFVAKPDEIFVTAFESENQYDTSTDSKMSIQSKLKTGDIGLCFGSVKECELQIQKSVYRMYGAFNAQSAFTDLTLLKEKPILVHKLRVIISLK